MRVLRFRQLPHSADVRLAIYGNSEEELLRHLALGLQRLALGSTPGGRPQEKTVLVLPDGDLGARLVRLGNEVVFWLFTKRLMTVDVRLSRPHAELGLRPVSPCRQLLFEVKAVTFHALRPQTRHSRLVAVLTLDL